MSSLLVGLTGGLASGKSTVAGMLREAGYRVLDADEIVAGLYAPGGAGAEAVRRLFGPDLLTAEGAVDHEAVAARVFGDGAALRALEAAIHPLVRARFAEIAGEADGVAVLEATLLAEAGHAPDFDLVVTVEADEAARLERAVARGLDRAQAEARLAAQGDGAARRAAADRVLRNDGDLADLRGEVDALIAEIERLRVRREPES